MSLRKKYLNISLLFALLLCSAIFLIESPVSMAARVDGSDVPVITTQTSPAAKNPQQESEPAADPAKKVIQGIPPPAGAPEKQESSVPQNVTPAQQKNVPATPDKSIKNDTGTVPPVPAAPIEKSLSAPAEPPAAKQKPADSVKRQAAEKYVTIDFDNVDIGVFIKFVSELTGKNFIIDDKVKGKVTIISPKKIPLHDVYKVFLSVLEVYGFTTVPVGDMIKVIPAVLAREKSVETRLKKEINDPEDRIVTQIITLERANPDEIKRVLDPIISKSSSVLSYPPAGMLVITDFLSNIKRLTEIIAALDVEGAGDQISYIPLQNASASEVVKSLTIIFQQRRPNATPLRIVSDSRTNSIIILASVADTENVRKLVAFMDKDVPRGESNIQVYRLQNSIAEDLAKVLNNIVKDTGAAASAAGGAAAAQRTLTPVVSKNVQVVPDKATNTLVIMAEREDYKIIENIIKQLDVPRPMVYIEALIMEVNANKAFNLGVEWRGLAGTGKVPGVDTGQSAAFFGSGGAGNTTNPGGYNILDTLTPTTFPGGFTMGIIGAGITIGGVLFPNIGAVVQAYKTDSEVSILSTPQIMTLDNEEAEINVGSNVPYITRQDSTATSGTVPVNYNTYEYKDVGVILNITPHINEENFIRLKISQQVTKVTSASTSATPTTLKRTAKTTVVIKDNETIVIGGLVGDSTQDNTYKVPLLGDIPLLGWLFKTHSTSREKTNLYVFLTPHIVRTQQDAKKIFDEKKETMGDVVEGVIKLNEKKPEQKPQSQVPPSENNIPAKSKE